MLGIIEISETMHAVYLTGHGGLDKLQYREDVPMPRLAPGEVLVEVSACGMNNTDIWVREGAYGTDDDPDATGSWRRGSSEETLQFPRIQGADIVGRIADVGRGVKRGRIGERVMVDFSIYNGDGQSLAEIDYIGHGRDGGYAEYVAVPAEQAWASQTTMTDAELATFCCAYLTGEHMLDRTGVKAGETVLITGASGGVGSGLIQLVRARGAVPYAVCGRGKMDAVGAIGAESVVARDESDLAQAVVEATKGQPIDVVADVVAGDMFGTLINLLRPEGRYTTAGAIGGAIVEIDLRTVYLKHLAIHGSSQGTRSAFERLHGYIEHGDIRPLLWQTYPLSKIRDAQTEFKRKDFVGKLVIQPDAKWQPVEPWYDCKSFGDDVAAPQGHLPS